MRAPGSSDWFTFEGYNGKKSHQQKGASLRCDVRLREAASELPETPPLDKNGPDIIAEFALNITQFPMKTPISAIGKKDCPATTTAPNSRQNAKRKTPAPPLQAAADRNQPRFGGFRSALCKTFLLCEWALWSVELEPLLSAAWTSARGHS